MVISDAKLSPINAYEQPGDSSAPFMHAMMMYVFTSQCQFTPDNYILKSFLLDIVAQEHKYGLNV